MWLVENLKLHMQLAFLVNGMLPLDHAALEIIVCIREKLAVIPFHLISYILCSITHI